MNLNDINELKKIQPAVISAIVTESGMSKDKLPDLNRRLLRRMSETEITNRINVIPVCKVRITTS